MLRHGTTPAARPRRRLRLATLVASVGLLASVSGCGLLSGEDESSSPDGGNGSVEKANIKVATLPSIDMMPLELAAKNGYFKDEGLNVTIEQTSSGQATLTKLISGDVDIALSSYTPFLVAQSQGAADIKFVADGVTTNPDSIAIVAMPNSNVKNVKNLEGKKVGVSALNTISDALVKSVMKSNGLDPNSVNFVPVSFPDMAGALSRGDIDAALMIEPFLTQASTSTGAVPVVDAATGPTKDFPLSGYGALSKFTEENPKTVAAFQRAMKKASEEAQDRSKIEPLVVEKIKVDADTVSLLKLPKFQPTLDASRIQRAADLADEFGITKKKVDVAPMIFKEPAT